MYRRYQVSFYSRPAVFFIVLDFSTVLHICLGFVYMPSARGPFLVACQQKAQKLKCYIPNRLKNKPKHELGAKCSGNKDREEHSYSTAGRYGLRVVVSRRLVRLEHQNHDVGEEAGSLQIVYCVVETAPRIQDSFDSILLSVVRTASADTDRGPKYVNGPWELLDYGPLIN